MNPPPPDDLSSLSMLELFRLEVETQAAQLTSGLLELEFRSSPQAFEALMRAAHSLKGAARIVNVQSGVGIAHAMEDVFTAAQHGAVGLRQREIDWLLQGVDLLVGLSKCAESQTEHWEAQHAGAIGRFLESVRSLLPGSSTGAAAAAPPGFPPQPPSVPEPSHLTAESFPGWQPAPEASAPPPLVNSLSPSAPLDLSSQTAAIRKPAEPQERVLRLAADNLNRLLGLAGESLVESRWLRPFGESLQRLKRHHLELAQKLEHLREVLEEERLSEHAATHFQELFRQLAEAEQYLAERGQELDRFDRRSAHLSQRLYLEVLRTRMRPFSDCVRRFPRMVRDIARPLGKDVKLEILGETTQVDRDVLERIETPLAHLLRNAVDHGCEPPEVRRQHGKPAEGTIRLEARHRAGVLLLTVTDDGPGVDIERVRRALLQRQLLSPAAAAALSETELLEFLFLPGFTLKEVVTELSGRGFGLDIVQNMVKSVRGSLRLSNQPGRGLRVQLQLPVTLSVLRALLVEVGGEPYAIPLSQLARTLKLSRASLQSLQGRPHFQFGGQSVGLLSAHELLDCGPAKLAGPELSVVLLGERTARFGLVVDRFLGEQELVVQPLDPRLGQLKDISAAALMQDGSPLLILDIEDLTHSIEKLLAESPSAAAQPLPLAPAAPQPKRILVVDDSLTVRELERSLLAARGFEIDSAADGLEAWNSVRTGDYDLVITDVDMPRLDGIGLATRIKADPRLKALPVLIVSYKDREADRLRGLQAGADYYVTKGTFHDETLVEAVVKLIGEPTACHSP